VLTEDFLNEDSLSAWGQPVTYTPQAGAPVAITAIKTRPAQFEGIAPGQNFGLWVRLSDIPYQPQRGDVVEVDSVVYDVVSVENDTAGGANLGISKF
jgi:hypothetical protein